MFFSVQPPPSTEAHCRVTITIRRCFLRSFSLYTFQRPYPGPSAFTVHTLHSRAENEAEWSSSSSGPEWLQELLLLWRQWRWSWWQSWPIHNDQQQGGRRCVIITKIIKTIESLIEIYFPLSLFYRSVGRWVGSNTSDHSVPRSTPCHAYSR